MKKKALIKSFVISLILTVLAALSATQLVRWLIDLAVYLQLDQEILNVIVPLRALPFSVSPIPIIVGTLILWLPLYGFCAKRGFFRRFFLLLLILILLVLIWVACLITLRIGLVSIVKMIFMILELTSGGM